jgi:hypothetical protein
MSDKTRLPREGKKMLVSPIVRALPNLVGTPHTTFKVWVAILYALLLLLALLDMLAMLALLPHE